MSQKADVMCRWGQVQQRQTAGGGGGGQAPEDRAVKLGFGGAAQGQ